MERKLDGNAASGILQEVFPLDMTTVQITCQGCSGQGLFGECAAYITGMGAVVRCPYCDNVLIRVVRGNGHYCIEMSGVRVLQISNSALW